MRLPRFSLRGLLLLTAFVAVFCYWRDRSRQIANWFVAAIEAGEYELAESMFIKPTPLAKTSLKDDAASYPQTFTEWLTGTCRVRFSIPVAWYYERDGYRHG